MCSYNLAYCTSRTRSDLSRSAVLLIKLTSHEENATRCSYNNIVRHGQVQTCIVELLATLKIIYSTFHRTVDRRCKWSDNQFIFVGVADGCKSTVVVKKAVVGCLQSSTILSRVPMLLHSSDFIV